METGQQIIWAIGLLGLILAIALWQRLENTLGLAVTVLRATLQLAVFGYLVALVLMLQQPLVSMGAIVGLGLVATLLLRNQLAVKLPLLPVIGLALSLGLAVPLIYVVTFVMPPSTWYDPQILLPLAGVVLANASSGGLLAADRLIQQLTQNQAAIETVLCLGGSGAQAVAPYRQAAIRSGLQPNLAALGVVGLGILPTFMAGELLGGVDPLKAAAVQLVVMLMSLLATLITVLVLCAGIQRQFLNDAEQLQQW
jgi:putative ABC transport system permease protein